jgi:hypothetical protein
MFLVRVKAARGLAYRLQDEMPIGGHKRSSEAVLSTMSAKTA